jgi:hypothetical protein
MTAAAPSSQRLEKLLLSQYRAYVADPHPHALAWVAPADVRVWFFLVGGLAAPFRGGEYLFRLTVPESYPSAPPQFEMLTPNGVYMPGGPTCVAFGDRLPGPAPDARNAYGWWPGLGMRGFATQVVHSLICFDALEADADPRVRIMRTPAPMKEALARVSWRHNLRFEPTVVAAFGNLLAGMPDVAPVRGILEARAGAPWRAEYPAGWVLPTSAPRPEAPAPIKLEPPPTPEASSSGDRPPRALLDRKGLPSATAPPDYRPLLASAPPRRGETPAAPDRGALSASAPVGDRPGRSRRVANLRADPDDEDLAEATRVGILEPDSDEEEPPERKGAAPSEPPPTARPSAGLSRVLEPEKPGGPRPADPPAGADLTLASRSAAAPASVPPARPPAATPAQPGPGPAAARPSAAAPAQKPGPPTARPGAAPARPNPLPAARPDSSLPITAPARPGPTASPAAPGPDPPLARSPELSPPTGAPVPESPGPAGPPSSLARAPDRKAVPGPSPPAASASGRPPPDSGARPVPAQPPQPQAVAPGPGASPAPVRAPGAATANPPTAPPAAPPGDPASDAAADLESLLDEFV